MKLLIESSNPSRSMNGGDYAKGYEIVAIESGCTVRVDRCYGSDYEGEYIHEYDLSVSPECAERLVQANPETFASQCNGKAVAALVHL